jgi:ATP-dependent DNA ligase
VPPCVPPWKRVKILRGVCESLRSLNRRAVWDGEIVILDHTGRPQFYELLRRRGEPVFYVFDCLMLDGRDLRPLPLLERKRALQGLVENHPRILFARHVERSGCDLFRLVCDGTLRGLCQSDGRRLRRGLVQDSQSPIFAIRGAA